MSFRSSSERKNGVRGVALQSYRLRALAAASATVLAPKAEAVIVDFVLNQPVTVPGGYTGAQLFFNLQDGATGTGGSYLVGLEVYASDSFSGPYFIYSFAGAIRLQAFYSNAGIIPYGGVIFCGSSNVDCGGLFSASGDELGSNSPYGSYARGGYLNYGDSYYAGFKMFNQGVGHDETYYGWIELNMTSGNSATLIQLAYDNSGGPIQIGATESAIPEPANAVLLLSSGAAGLALLRRRRQQKKAAEAAAV